MRKYLVYTPDQSEPSATGLLEVPKAELGLDILDCAEQLRIDYGEYILPPEQHLYHQKRMTPILLNGQQYYNADRCPITIDDIIDQPTNVFNRKGILVLSKDYLERNHKLISTRPTFPIRELEIIEALIIEYMDNKSYSFKIAKHLTYAGAIAVKEETILLQQSIHDIVEAIDEFIGDDIHHIYQTTFQGTMLILGKFIDYRIYLWAKNHEKEFSMD